MDIKKLFAYVLTDKKVERFFRELQSENEIFCEFNSLSEFIQFMHTPSPQSVPLQNHCLLSIISRIQYTAEKEAGLSLMTYLLSPGLQKLLYSTVPAGEIAQEKLQSLCGYFFHVVNKYPVLKRPNKVALNLMLDTLKEVLNERRYEQNWQRMESIDSPDFMETPPVEISSLLEKIKSFIEGDDSIGMTAEDKELILCSRIYDEPMQEIANRLGLNSTTLYHKRKQAEQKLKDRWKDEQ